MFVIKDISMKIKRMLDCADRYSDDAALFSTTNPKTAMAYAAISEKLLSCVMDLHNVAVEEVKKTREARTEPVPESMQNMWDTEHVYLVDKHSAITQKIKTTKSML